MLRAIWPQLGIGMRSWVLLQSRLCNNVIWFCSRTMPDHILHEFVRISWQNNNIAPLAWPPYSPDLTPIEHMWDELDRRVRKRRNPPATLAQLRNALIDEWNNIPMRTVNALVNSIQRRIRAATAARGGHTRYWFSVWFWFQDLGGSYQWTSITRDLLITNQWNLELLFHTCTVL